MESHGMTEKSRESLEASIMFMDGNSTEPSSELNMSDDNLEGYLTPTGSSSQVDSSETPSSRIQDTPLHHLNICKNGAAFMKCPLAENRALQTQIDEAVSCSRVEVIEYLRRENDKLQRELDEARAHVDEVDIEAEQQYTEMSSEITELCELVEKKDNELKALKERLSEVNKLAEKNNDVADHQKQTVQRQKEIIESLRDELDSERDKSAHLTKENDILQEKLNLIRKTVKAEKDDALAKDVLLSIEIEDLQRELEKQKEILATTSIAQIVDRWERRVLTLEDEVRERDILIHTQQSLINDLKRIIRENSGLLHSGGSTDSFQTLENNPSSRFSIVDYILSDVNSQLANVYAIARILDLSSQELDYLEKSLESKQSRRHIF